MTERRRRVEDVLESMGRMVVPVADDPDAHRARVIAALDQKLDSARAAQKLRRRTRFLLAVAACFALAGAASAANLLRARLAGPPAVAVTPSDMMRRGDTITTAADEQRQGQLENGAALSVSPSTELTVSAVAVGGDELILDRGRIELKVPKLVAGRTLSVTTPDATVTVRGTRFAVEVRLQDSHPTTHVDVSEGSVWVRTGSERLVLEAGSHWTSPAAQVASPHADAPAVDPAPANATPASAPTPASVAAPASGAQSAALREKSASAVASAAKPSDGSTLAEENALYERASRALRGGQTATGLAALEQLLARYPRSPLAQNAVVERYRALRRSGRNAEAVAQARQYLASYPQGFARDEAKALVVDSLPKNP